MELVVAVRYKTLCCVSKKRWSVDYYFFFPPKNRIRFNASVVVAIIYPLCLTKVLVCVFSE